MGICLPSVSLKNRKYENRNLAQMKTVYPRSFIFRQEKHIPGIYDHKTFESYQLTVECNVREDGRQGQGEGEEREKERVNEVLDSSALLRRRKVFNKNLCDITRRHHEVSLLTFLVRHSQVFFIHSLSFYTFFSFLSPSLPLSAISLFTESAAGDSG